MSDRSSNEPGTTPTRPTVWHQQLPTARVNGELWISRADQGGLQGNLLTGLTTGSRGAARYMLWDL